MMNILFYAIWNLYELFVGVIPIIVQTTNCIRGLADAQ